MAKLKISIKEKLDKAKSAMSGLTGQKAEEARKNAEKLSDDFNLAVENLKEKISETRSLSELQATEIIFEEIFGMGAAIPEEIQTLYNNKMAELQKAKKNLREEVALPAGWVKMTHKEARLHEEKGVLVGYDAENGHGLIAE